MNLFFICLNGQHSKKKNLDLHNGEFKQFSQINTPLKSCNRRKKYNK